MSQTTIQQPSDSAPDEAVPMLTLTDEELAVLGAAGGIGVLPIWADLTEDQRAMGARTAFRGLIARRLVAMPTPDAVADFKASGPDADLRVEIREDVSSLLAIRGGSPVVIAVARTAALGQDFLYAHVAGDAVMVEEVAGEGIHEFALMGASQLATFLPDSVLHPQAADGQGSSYRVPAGGEVPATLATALGDGHLRADVVLRRHTDADFPLLGIFSGPSGTWMLRAGSGVSTEVVAEPVTVAAARQALEEIARTATEIAEAEVTGS